MSRKKSTKSAQPEVKPQLIELEQRFAAVFERKQSDSMQQHEIMEVVKAWFSESEFGKSVRLLANLITEGQVGDSQWLDETLIEAGVDLTESQVNRAVYVIDLTLGELELKELIEENKKLARDLAAFNELKDTYSEMRMPQSLANRLERCKIRLAVLKKNLPDLDFPDVCDED